MLLLTLLCPLKDLKKPFFKGIILCFVSNIHLVYIYSIRNIQLNMKYSTKYFVILVFFSFPDTLRIYIYISKCQCQSLCCKLPVKIKRSEIFAVNYAQNQIFENCSQKASILKTYVITQVL